MAVDPIWQSPGPGRPRGRTKTILSASIPISLFDALDALAKANERTVSHYAARAIEHYMRCEAAKLADRERGDKDR